MKEEWRDIKGFEGRYQVSNMGRVKSLDHEVIMKNGGKYPVKGKIKKPYKINSGYYTMQLSKGVQKKLVHRLVAEAFINNHKNKPNINHIDKNKINNKADNLEWVTQSENCLHSSPEAAKARVKSSNGRPKGISKSNHQWKAEIYIDNHMYFIGNYYTKYEAYKAYYDVFLEWHGYQPFNIDKIYQDKKNHIKTDYMKEKTYLRGVSPIHGGWQACFYFKRKQYYLGRFTKKEDAYKAYYYKFKEFYGYAPFKLKDIYNKNA
jgi:hypothetical protein